jgi:hypothetical protein
LKHTLSRSHTLTHPLHSPSFSVGDEDKKEKEKEEEGVVSGIRERFLTFTRLSSFFSFSFSSSFLLAVFLPFLSSFCSFIVRYFFLPLGRLHFLQTFETSELLLFFLFSSLSSATFSLKKKKKEEPD